MQNPPPFALRGSQRWLQVAVNRAPQLLDEALRKHGVIDSDESLVWSSPLADEQFTEYRDESALLALKLTELPRRSLEDFWPRRGPVWDGLAVTNKKSIILVEAKAHIPEVLSPPSQAGEKSKMKIIAALEEARKFYAPRSNKVWFEHFYQYCNRLAFHYFLTQVNQLPSKLVFLDFYNAMEMNGPTSPEEWQGATKVNSRLNADTERSAMARSD